MPGLCQIPRARNVAGQRVGLQHGLAAFVVLPGLALRPRRPAHGKNAELCLFRVSAGGWLVLRWRAATTMPHRQGCPSMTWLFYTLPLLLLLAAIWIYNRLVFNRQRVAEAWSGIEVQLKRRSSLIPPLVECVRQYQQHEQDTLLQVSRL